VPCLINHWQVQQERGSIGVSGVDASASAMRGFRNNPATGVGSVGAPVSHGSPNIGCLLRAITGPQPHFANRAADRSAEIARLTGVVSRYSVMATRLGSRLTGVVVGFAVNMAACYAAAHLARSIAPTTFADDQQPTSGSPSFVNPAPWKNSRSSRHRRRRDASFGGVCRASAARYVRLNGDELPPCPAGTQHDESLA
jgi:hypothetical protein